MDLKHLSKKEKVLIFGGAGVVIFFLLKSLKGQSSASTSGTTAQADSTGQMANMMQQFMQAQQQQNASLLSGMQQSQPDITGALNQTVTQFQTALAQQLQAEQQSQQQTMAQMASLFAQHQTASQQAATAAAVTAPVLSKPSVIGTGPAASNVYHLPSATTVAQEQVMATQPQTNVVRAANGSVYVAQGGSSYNNAVDAAGGQNLIGSNGKSSFYDGSYSGGVFRGTLRPGQAAPKSVPGGNIVKVNGNTFTISPK